MKRTILAALALLLTACTPATLTPAQRLEVAVPYVRTSLTVACASLAYLDGVVTPEEAAHLRGACDALRVLVGETLEVVKGRVGQ